MKEYGKRIKVLDKEKSITEFKIKKLEKYYSGIG
jgi:hypothetical protein